MVKDTASTTTASEVLTSAPPPMHTAALVAAMTSIFLYHLPTVTILDEIATVDSFSHSVFPEYISLQGLALIRFLIAISIWLVMLQTCMGSGWVQETSYQPGSKLKRVPNEIRGIKTFFPFTCVSWNLLGLSFSLNAYIAYVCAQGQEQDIPNWVIRLALLVWHVAAPNTLLVASVIRYAIWPASLKSGNPTTNLKSFRNVMMHNINVVYALAEMSLLGGLPCDWRLISLAPLVGCVYVIFSWLVANCWNEPKYGPQFIYFFFDTTLPGWVPTIALLALFVVMLVFFCIFAVATFILEHVGGGLLQHASLVALVSSSVMRFRD